MKFDGVVENFNSSSVSGWVKWVAPDNFDESSEAVIRVFHFDDLLGEGIATISRPDLISDGFKSYGFLIKLKKLSFSELKYSGIKVIALVGGNSFVLRFVKTVESSLFLNTSSSNVLAKVVQSLDAESIKKLSALVDFEKKSIGLSKITRKKACVVTYANDNGAWFPYFYKYYSSIFGSLCLYVITPKPERFSSYNLGGIITIPDLIFDDIAKSRIMGNLASGLLAYYKWSIVCDVDEILMPNPRLGINLDEYLDSANEEIILSLGVDVVQLEDDFDFDFDKSIISQRRFGVLNTALCKPNISSVPVRYSGGHHYCDKRLNFNPSSNDLLSLHLKWACNKVRAEVANIVNEVIYQDAEIETYCRNSVISDSHPLMKTENTINAVDLDSLPVEKFKEEYNNQLRFDSDRGFWVGDHRSADFFVQLPVNNIAT